RDWFVSIICNDEKNGKIPHFFVLDGKNVRLVWHVVRIDAYGDMLLGMGIICGVALGRLRRGHDKVLCCPIGGRHRKADNQKPGSRKTVPSHTWIRGCDLPSYWCFEVCQESAKMSLPMYLIYSALLAACLILGLPYWLWQMFRHGKYHK